MEVLDGKKGSIWEVCVPRINNSAERREITAFSGVWEWGFSRAGGVSGKTGERGGGMTVASGVRRVVIKMAFRPRV